MALSAAVVWEVRTTGAATNGGGFKTGASGTDWSQQDAAQYSVTDGVTAGTTTITSATANFGTDVVGNLIYVQGGTGSITAGWYEITARASSTSITVDRSTGLTTGTGVTLIIGGCLNSVPTSALVAVGNKIWVKAGTYTVGSSQIWGHTDSSPADTWYVGYNATRGDTLRGGTLPLISLTASGATIQVSGAGTRAFNFDFDGTDTATTCVTGGSYGSRGAGVYNCVARRAATYGFNCDGLTVFGCRGTDMKAGATAAFYEVAIAVDSVADANPCTGFSWQNNSGSGRFVRCISANNSGASSDGFGGNNVLQGLFVFINCIAFSNGRHGIAIPTYPVGLAYNNILCSNGGYGLSVGGLANAPASIAFDCNAFYNNTSGARSGLTAGPGDITLTADPFANAAGGDFSLNTTAGAGAACRAAGYPGAFPGGLTTGYLDIGAVQHADPVALAGGGAGVGFARNRSIYF